MRFQQIYLLFDTFNKRTKRFKTYRKKYNLAKKIQSVKTQDAELYKFHMDYD